MLETLFRSITLFRQRVGSIHTHRQLCTLAHTCTNLVAMVSVCFLHVAVTPVMCVSCAEGHGDPSSQQLFLKGDTSITLQQHRQPGPAQPKTGSDSLSASHLHRTTAAVSPRIISKQTPTYVWICTAEFQYMARAFIKTFKRTWKPSTYKPFTFCWFLSNVCT